MALKKLPLYSDSLYSYETDLDDESFTLTFRWNSRLGFYVMDIENAEEAAAVIRRAAAAAGRRGLSVIDGEARPAAPPALPAAQDP